MRWGYAVQVMLWLVPVAVIAVAGAVLTAWLARPPRKPTMARSMRAHRKKVDALASTWRPQHRSRDETAESESRTVRLR